MFQIDALSRRPVYEQILQQLEYFILTDIFREGDQIPSVRSVSMEHSVNPRTILKAYNELDRKGVIQSVPGKGYFVCKDAKTRLTETHLAKLSQLREMIEDMALAGVPKDVVLACVERAYEQKNEKQDTGGMNV